MTIELRTVDSDRTPIWQQLLARQDPYPLLSDALDTILRPGGGGAAVVQGPWCHAVDRRGGIMLSALLHREGGGPMQVRSFHPYTESGYLWPMQVQVIERSSDGGTGVVMGHCGPASIAVFDTMHFRSNYVHGQQYAFQVSGIALALHRATLPAGYSEDFCGYGSLRQLTGDRSKPADVIELSAVVAATQPARFWGVPLTRYLLTIARPPTGDMTFDVYGNDEAVGRYEVGDRVSGHVWVFGFSPV